MKQVGEASFETDFKKKDGSMFKGEVVLTSLDLEEEATVQCAIRDITEKEMLKGQLLQAQKMEAIGTLVGGIAHDFNNMLAAIDGNLYLARGKLEKGHKAAEKLANIEQLSKRAAEMVQQLLTFARKGHVETSIFSLRTFIEEAFKLSKTTMPKNIVHICELCPEDMFIEGNKTMLQQALMNLLNNARDAVADSSDPEIHCSLKPIEVSNMEGIQNSELESGHYACLTVCDNGHGIAREHMTSIFEPFFSTKAVGKGTGLGLSMVYGAVKSHHGVIDVESETGKGTVFHIYFPQQVHSEELPLNVDVKQIEQGSETILLVDDDVRTTTYEVLKGMGYELLTASGGHEALTMMEQRQHDIDVMISDVIMPDMGGVELAKRVKQINKQLPVILTSGCDMDLVAIDEGKQVEYVLVRKPFAFESLVQAIRLSLNK